MSQNAYIPRKKYKEADLRGMSSYQLREICQQERLVKSYLMPLDREELIRLILRYRGEREQRCIIDYYPGGLERVDAFLGKVMIEETEDYRFRPPAKVTVYEGLSVEMTDDYRIVSEGKLSESNLLLMDDSGRVRLIFYLKKGPGETCFLMKGKDISLDAYGESETKRGQYYLAGVSEEVSDYLFDLYYGESGSSPAQITITKYPLLDFRSEKVPETTIPLVIDFGSSNTALGICRPDGTMEMVEAALSGAKDYRTTNLIPSVIGVADAKSEEDITYVFGFEALMLAKKNYQDEDLPVFYDLKRWISDYEKKEQVILAGGLRLSISRKSMLKAFLTYITDLAGQYFKYRFQSVQMLAPVRQKDKFRSLFNEVLEDYKVGCVLDEGMAVLYHSIKKMMDRKLYQSGQWYRALVIDCGGGTTDLTSGRFCISNNQVSYEVSLETSYENGDTNFGGNNLTFRILQFLKVRMAESIRNQEALQLSPENYRNVDQLGRDAVYAKLEAAYLDAERVIPTRYRDYENHSKEEYFRVKNNYYYLFNLAEEIKKIFFMGSHLYEIHLLSQEQKKAPVPAGNVSGEALNRRQTMFLDKWLLSVLWGGRMEVLKKDIDLTIYLFEIEALLRPDVYSIIKKLLDRPYAAGELDQYEIIHLTGQSCESPLFVEALKEFIPGRTIQSSDYSKGEHELKLCCLKGAQSWFHTISLGYIKVEHSFRVSALPYEIVADTHENENRVLIRCLQKEDTTGWISRFMTGRQLNLLLKNTEGKPLKTYHYQYDIETFQTVTQEGIEEAYDDTVIQEQTDNIGEGEMKFFVWVSREQWGFYLLPVLRQGKQLLKGEEKFYAFEDDTWERNFFDGTN